MAVGQVHAVNEDVGDFSKAIGVHARLCGQPRWSSSGKRHAIDVQLRRIIAGAEVSDAPPVVYSGQIGQSQSGPSQHSHELAVLRSQLERPLSGPFGQPEKPAAVFEPVRTRLLQIEPRRIGLAQQLVCRTRRFIDRI